MVTECVQTFSVSHSFVLVVTKEEFNVGQAGFYFVLKLHQKF
jgi:hypothetical protein